MAILAEHLPDPEEDDFQVSLDWKESAATKKLLDVLVVILAEEYVETARKNPEIFTE